MIIFVVLTILFSASSLYIQNRHNVLDMRIVKAWEKGYTGKGVIISCLDDGKNL